MHKIHVSKYRYYYFDAYRRYYQIKEKEYDNIVSESNIKKIIEVHSLLLDSYYIDENINEILCTENGKEEVSRKISLLHAKLKDPAFNLDDERRYKIQIEINSLEKVFKQMEPRKLENDYFVDIGHFVTFNNPTSNKTMEIRVVGELEINPEKKYISYKSPIGEAILFKMKGDIFSYKSADGNVHEDIIIDIKLPPQK